MRRERAGRGVESSATRRARLPSTVSRDLPIFEFHLGTVVSDEGCDPKVCYGESHTMSALHHLSPIVVGRRNRTLGCLHFRLSTRIACNTLALRPEPRDSRRRELRRRARRRRRPSPVSKSVETCHRDTQRVSDTGISQSRERDSDLAIRKRDSSPQNETPRPLARGWREGRGRPSRVDLSLDTEKADARTLEDLESRSRLRPRRGMTRGRPHTHCRYQLGLER